MTHTITAIIIAILLGGNNFLTSLSQTSSVPVEQYTQLNKFDDDPRPIRGTIKKPNLDPLPAATVRLYTFGGTLLQTVSSNSVGWYEFTPVLPGAYSVKVTASGYQEANVPATVTTAPVTLNITMQE